MQKLLTVSLFGIALLTGCAAVYMVRPGSLKPATATVDPATRSTLWQGAVVVLVEQGYVPQVLNEAAGYISARRREDIVGDALAGTTALVVISPQGLVRVEVSGSGIYHSEEEFLSAVRERQKTLLGLIVGGGANVREAGPTR